MPDLDVLRELYLDLHAHPELSFAEHRTAGIVARLAEEAGCEVVTGIAGTGVAAVLANGDGPVVWLRADMDGLPLREQTGLPYASTATGIAPDGSEVPVMHGCGHDMHITWLIGALQSLAERRSEWSGTVVGVFQPAEEVVGGARGMVDDGLLAKVPAPAIVLGQHVAPLPAGVVSLTAGTAMAGVDELAVTLHGRGGHGSRPETTVDPVVAAAAVVTRLQTVVAREATPGRIAVITVGTLHAGSKPNVIPDEATLGVNIRSADPETRELLVAATRRVIEGEAAVAGMTRPPTIEATLSAPPTINAAGPAEELREVFAGAWGEAAVIDHGTVSGSEDVGILAQAAQAPLVFWITGGADPAAFAAAQAAGRLDQDIPSNHSPFYAPVIDPTLERGVDALVLAATHWLGR